MHGEHQCGFGDRLSIAHVILLSTQKWLNVLRRQQLGLVPKFLEFPCPVMCSAASFHGDSGDGDGDKGWE